MASGGNTSGAKKILMDALAQNENNIEILNALGDLTYLSEELNDAIHFYEKSLRIFSQQPNILFNVALIHKYSGNLVKALEAYTRALEIRPNDLECLNNRGNIFRELRLFEKAFQDLIKANEILNSQPNIKSHKVEPWIIELNLGNILMLLGRYDEAIIFFDKGLSSKKLLPDFLKSKGVCLMYLARYQDSIDCLIKALDIGPHDLRMQFDLALAYLSIGKYDEGFAMYETRPFLKKLERVIWTGAEDVSGKIIYVKAEQVQGISL